MHEVLSARGIVKRYGGALALDSVDFSVRSHAVNVLIGENGAGKSTLMRILAGVEQPTSGGLWMDGREVRFDSVADAAAHGVGIVHQELNLCPNLSVADNIFLGRSLTRSGGIALDREAERRRTRELLARLEQNIDPDTPVEQLRIGQQQIVEIAKALNDKCRVLILDEPTSALSAAEVEVLFKLLAELRRDGVAIIYISHKLEELLRIGDIITVLRDGRIVDSAPVGEASVSWIVERMLGDAGKLRRLRSAAAAGERVLEVAGLTVERIAGSASVTNLSASFHAGEITAIYGLLGAGRTELFEAICGARRATSGEVRLRGVSLGGQGVAERVARGLCLVPEDRQREGLFANLSVGENMSLAELAGLARLGVVSQQREEAAVGGMIQRLRVKTAGPEQPIGDLSGGNQQKVVIGRALMAGPAALLLDEPSRGVDVGARAEIFTTMQQLAQEGLAVAFSTSDLAEARTVADRILVMAGGRITLDMPVDQVDEAALVRAANAQPAAPPSETIH